MLSIEIRRVRSVLPEDCSNYETNPIATYYTHYGKAHFVPVELWRCRQLGPLAFPVARGKGNPFVETLVEYERGVSTTYDNSYLMSYYKKAMPERVKDVMDCHFEDEETGNLPPMGFLLPWQPGDASAMLMKRRVSNEEENALHGQKISIEEGFKAWGPVSRRKGLLEYDRLISTYNSIRQRGYLKYEGPPVTGEVLISDKGWRVRVGVGQHRVAALAALNYGFVPICLFGKDRLSRGIGELIRREDVMQWPQVAMGVLRKEEALRVFDRIWAGDQPELFRCCQ